MPLNPPKPSRENYIAFVLIKDEKEYNAVYFAQYAVKIESDRTLMIELLHYVQTQFPGQCMIGVGRRINQNAAQFFAENSAKVIENDESIAIRHGYDPKDYIAFQYY